MYPEGSIFCENTKSYWSFATLGTAQYSVQVQLIVLLHCYLQLQTDMFLIQKPSASATVNDSKSVSLLVCSKTKNTLLCIG